MNGGVVVCGRVFTPELLERIKAAVREHADWTRSRLARAVCEWLEWRGANEAYKQMSCRKALGKLWKKGVIELPNAQRQVRFAGKSYAATKLEVPDSLCVELAAIQELELVAVHAGNHELSAQWNKLVATHHYLGYHPLAGAQLRYLIRSEYGYLGALGFRSAALRLKVRDRWIGWSHEARQAYLEQVVCNARFVIAAGVRVKNLASKVLSMATARLPDDWHQAYGVRPLLVETYVDRTRFDGACYRAANWQQVGLTRGSTAADRRQGRHKARKTVFLYPLVSDFRERLCEAPGPARMSEAARWGAPGPASDCEPWVELEFRRAALRDHRLDRRLRTLAWDFFEQPQASIPQACGSTAKTKAAYRFFDRVSMEQILAPHFHATMERVAYAPHAVVLAVQDSTALNYTAHPATTGLGALNNQGDRARGLWLHDTMVYTAAGTALGLIDIQIWARPPEEMGKAATRHDRPIEQKESVKWLKSFAAAARLQRQVGPGVMVVSVGDREADIYEVFARALSDAINPKLLVRGDSKQRLLETADEAGRQKVWEYLAHQPASEPRRVTLPRHKGRPKREAQLQVRFAEVILRPPKRKSKMAALRLWAVYVTEFDAPSGVEPLEWMLWTTVPVSSPEQAWEKVQWYKRRWGIEEFHRTLKSGCRIEDRQLQDCASLESCLALDLVVAWRIEHMKKLSREEPALPCTVAFSEHESQVLAAKFTPQTLRNRTQLSIREAVRFTAQLGGFLARKGDGEPGAITLWRGLARLQAIVEGWELARQTGSPDQLPSNLTVSTHTDYG